MTSFVYQSFLFKGTVSHHVSSVGLLTVKIGIFRPQVLVFFLCQRASMRGTQLHRFWTCILGCTGLHWRGVNTVEESPYTVYVANSFANPGQGYAKLLHRHVLRTSPLCEIPSAFVAPLVVSHLIPVHAQNDQVFQIPLVPQSSNT